MTAPTHIAAGALVATILVIWTEGWRRTRLRSACVLVAAALLAIGVHFLLDLIPHYNWVANSSLFAGSKNGWYYREAVALLPVAAILLVLGRRNAVWVLVGMVAGLYPDIEKFAYLAFRIPERFVLFDWHSRALSAHNMGLPNWVLGIVDMTVLAICVAGVWRLNRPAARQGPS